MVCGCALKGVRPGQEELSFPEGNFRDTDVRTVVAPNFSRGAAVDGSSIAAQHWTGSFVILPIAMPLMPNNIRRHPSGGRERRSEI